MIDSWQRVFEYGFWYGSQLEQIRGRPAVISWDMSDLQVDEAGLKLNRPMSTNSWKVLEERRRKAAEGIKELVRTDWEGEQLDIEKCTCNDCPGAMWGCEFAYDLYNISGDCLAAK